MCVRWRRRQSDEEKVISKSGGGGKRGCRQMTTIFLRVREPGLQRFHRCWSEEKSGDGKEADERKGYLWGGRAW